ncbi:MAG: ornithine cyclodeaminase family protein [Alicyclobacillus sp.]|nr:ornithine cyclodeaminase family protein [Alicyclobacillus sp.]
MRVLGKQDVRVLLPMEACIEVMDAVLRDLAEGRTVQPLRSVLPLQGDRAFALMPGWLPGAGTVGAKLLAIVPGNHARGLSSHQGVVVLFDAVDGRPVALLDASSITAIRTAAVSAVATRALARADAHTLAILGTGEQARTHLQAMLCVRPLDTVRVWGRTPVHAEAFVQEMARATSVGIDLCPSVEACVAGADIICTVTAAAEPVLSADWVQAGAHINAVGACRPHERELDTALVQQSALFVDRAESARSEAGDFLIPLHEGAIGADHIRAELGEVLTGMAGGRTNGAEVTVFKSLGLAVEDLAAAAYIFREAERRGQGVTVEL